MSSPSPSKYSGQSKGGNVVNKDEITKRNRQIYDELRTYSIINGEIIKNVKGEIDKCNMELNGFILKIQNEYVDDEARNDVLSVIGNKKNDVRSKEVTIKGIENEFENKKKRQQDIHSERYGKGQTIMGVNKLYDEWKEVRLEMIEIENEARKLLGTCVFNPPPLGALKKKSVVEAERIEAENKIRLEKQTEMNAMRAKKEKEDKEKAKKDKEDKEKEDKEKEDKEKARKENASIFTMPSFGKNKTGVDSGKIDVQLFLADARNLFTTIGIWENDNTKDVVPKMTMLSSKLEEIQDMRRYVRENFNNPATHAYLREAEGFVSEVSRLIKDMRDLREIVHSNTENMNLIFSRIERQSNSQDVLNGLAKEFYSCVAHIMAAYHEMRDISNEEYKVPDDSVLIGRARGFEPVVANKLAEINGKVTEMDVEIGKVVDRVSKKKSEFTDAIDVALKYKLRVETVYEKNRDRDILCATVDNYVKDARKSVNSLDTEISKCKVKYGAMSNLRSIFAKYTPDNIAGINDRSVHIVRRCVTMTSEITQILVDVDKIHCLKFKVDNDLKNKLIRIKRGREEEEKEGEEKEGEEKEGE